MNKIKIYGWHATIGDPTFMGWFTVVMYFFVTVLAFKLAMSSSFFFSEENKIKQKRFWLIIAMIMLCLGINKQLDLQSLLTAIGKYYAHRDGWYQHRRNIQVEGIIAILSLALIGLVFFAIRMRSILKTNGLAMLGLAFLLAFVMIRATSFHHMDILINTTFFGVRMNWVLELSGIIAIGLSALINLKNRNK